MSLEQGLPIFPLHTVLFPGMTIPLHIFEDRYKTMINKCLDGDRTFGIALIRSGREVRGPAVPHAVGTLARISEVQRLEAGKMDIQVVGTSRFRIIAHAQERPYLVARVEPIMDNVEEEIPPSLIDDVTDAVLQYFAALADAAGKPFPNETLQVTEVEALSFFIPTMLEISAEEKQSLLETLSTTKRLEMELAILRREQRFLGLFAARQYTAIDRKRLSHN